MKRTLRALIFAAAVAGLASGANAASVTLVTSKGGITDGSTDSLTFMPGDTITLYAKVSVLTTDDDPTIAVVGDDAIFGAIQIAGAPIPAGPYAPGTQTALPGWATSVPALTCTTSFCRLFDQVDSVAPFTVAADVSGFAIGQMNFSVSLAATPGDTFTFSWRTAPTTQNLDFFNVQGGAGTVSVSVVPIPEPTTAAMLGLGVLGLALAGRRRA
jgi:hypothetical protein